VGTLAAHRKRGHASAAVLAAVSAARAEALDPVFLITDAGDWPQYLYRRLGFDHFDRRWEFMKLPLSTSPT
jgi:ribosomal protein S18 acetylase RimI-like enzyme